jgi:hypothetical protein
MNPIQSFDPIANPSGIITTNGINKNEQLLIFNSSLACLQLTFADKTNDILPPSWCRDWIKSSPMGNIQYKTLFTLPIEGQPISKLYGTLYEPDEHVSSVNGPLQYVYIVGNSGGIPVTNNTLSNTGNNPGTNVITVQPSDATQPTVILDNSGNFTIKSSIAGVLTNLLQLIAGASPEVIIAASTIITQILGNLQVIGSSSLDDGNIISDGLGTLTVENLVSNNNITAIVDMFLKNQKLSTSSSGDLIDWTTNTEVFFKAISSGFPARLRMGVGSRSDWTIGSINSGQASGTSGTVNHGMNIPNIPIIVPITSQPGSATCGVGNVTNSSFKWTIGAGTGIYWFVYGK